MQSVIGIITLLVFAAQAGAQARRPRLSAAQAAQLETALKNSSPVLTTSQNPYALAKAGNMLSWQGLILYDSRKLAFGPVPLAEAALRRADRLAPGDREIAFLMEQFQKIQSQKRKTGQ